MVRKKVMRERKVSWNDLLDEGKKKQEKIRKQQLMLHITLCIEI